MNSAWDWTNPIREKHFGEPLAGRYALERLEASDYWPLHEVELRQHFPEEFYFDLRALASEAEQRARTRIEASEAAVRLADFWAVRDGDRIVAMFSGHQKDADTWRMWHTNIHPDYRRRGLYAEIIQRTLAYARELGFSVVVSEHAPSNNPVLIAKLKAGFRVAAMELDPAVGPSLVLKYFHDEAHRRAYEFRCGHASLDDGLIRSGFGAWSQLLEQIRRQPV